MDLNERMRAMCEHDRRLDGLYDVVYFSNPDDLITISHLHRRGSITFSADAVRASISALLHAYEVERDRADDLVLDVKYYAKRLADLEKS